MAAVVMTPGPVLQIPDGPGGNPIISVEYEVYGQVQGNKIRFFSERIVNKN